VNSYSLVRKSRNSSCPIKWCSINKKLALSIEMYGILLNKIYKVIRAT